MKTIKTFTLVSVLTIGLTTSVFASWWNPTTWQIFKKNVTQQVVVDIPAPVAQNNVPITTSETQVVNKPISVNPEVSENSATELKQENKIFTKPLFIGMTDPEVKNLQALLSKDKKIYPEGKVTGSFDTATKKAVQRFQDKYNLATPEQKLTANYGAVGPKTGEMLVKVFSELKTNTNVKDLTVQKNIVYSVKQLKSNNVQVINNQEGSTLNSVDIKKQLNDNLNIQPIVLLSPKNGDVYKYGKDIPFSFKINTDKKLLLPMISVIQVANYMGNQLGNFYGNSAPYLYSATISSTDTSSIQNGTIPFNIILNGGKFKLEICEYPKIRNSSYPKEDPFCAETGIFTVNRIEQLESVSVNKIKNNETVSDEVPHIDSFAYDTPQTNWSPLKMYISGTGFTAKTKVHISGNGFDDFVPQTSISYEFDQLNVLLPSNINTGFGKYDVYVSNGEKKSNIVSTGRKQEQG